MRVSVRIDVLHRVEDEEVMALSERNPGHRFERTREGGLLVSPTGGISGHQSSEVPFQLARWSHETGGGPTFASSTGFYLSDGSCLSPDPSWMCKQRWQSLSRAQRRGLIPLCQDAVFEIRSSSDALAELRAKMGIDVGNGTPIAVLIDPERRSVEVFRPGREPQPPEGVASLDLDPELPRFMLDLTPVFSA